MMTYNCKSLNKFLIVAASFMMWQGCLKSDLINVDGIELSPSIALPLARATFAFQDFIKSDSALTIDNTGSVQMVYSQNNIATYTTADVVAQATGNVSGSVNKNVPVGDLAISGLNISKSTALSSFSSSFAEPVKSLLLNGGSSGPFGVPAFSQATNTITNLDDATEYQTITLSSGMLNLSAKNNFPFDLSDLNIELIDRANGATVAILNIASLASGGTGTATADLSNKTFSNQLAYRVPTLSCPGIAANTTIVPSQTLDVAVTSTNMKMKSGRVKITEQALAADNAVVDIATGNAAQRMHEITIKSATATYTITKTIAANFRLELTFPSIKQGGVAVKKTIDLNSNSVTGTIEFLNAIADLTTVAAQPYNKLPIQATATVLSSGGNYVAIAATDAITINTTFGNIKVDGAKGQFGSFNIAIPKKTINFGYDFSFLSKSSQKLLFDNPAMKLRYDNSFGIPISAALNVSASGLLGTNEKLLPPTIAISYPKIAQIGTTVKDSFSITKANSSIVNFLSILPQTIDYDGNVTINSTNNAEVNYFLPNSKINMGIDFVLPFKFSTQDLIIRDTIEAAFVDAGTSTTSYESAALLIEHTNGFPLKTSIDLIGLTGTTTTPIVTGFAIPSATVGTDGRVSAANAGKQTLTLDNAQLSNLLKSTKIIIVGHVQTAAGGATPIVMLPTYTFDVGIGLKAKLKVKQ